MSEHPVLSAIRNESFTPLGWFVPEPSDEIASVHRPVRFVILVGNAGAGMFRRFRRERDPSCESLDGWCRMVIGDLAQRLGAEAVFPFDKPAAPFVKWAKRSGSVHQSPLGLGIHADYGLWHAYRAALLFPVEFDIPQVRSRNPCDSCAEKPCLSACPVGAFTGSSYDVDRCVDHLAAASGVPCMAGGCLARRACPVGQAFSYEPAQARFHMAAFRTSRLAARGETG
jgi:ferredoxin